MQSAEHSYEIAADGATPRCYLIERQEGGLLRVTMPDGEVRLIDAYAPEPGRLHWVDQERGAAWDVGAHAVSATRWSVDLAGVQSQMEVLNARQRRMLAAGGGPRKAQGPDLKSPMAGKVVAISATVGAQVEEGDRLLVVEAMKMENDLKAHLAGELVELLVEVGQAVEVGQVLARIHPAAQ